MPIVVDERGCPKLWSGRVSSTSAFNKDVEEKEQKKEKKKCPTTPIPIPVPLSSPHTPHGFGTQLKLKEWQTKYPMKFEPSKYGLNPAQLKFDPSKHPLNNCELSELEQHVMQAHVRVHVDGLSVDDLYYGDASELRL